MPGRRVGCAHLMASSPPVGIVSMVAFNPLCPPTLGDHKKRRGSSSLCTPRWVARAKRSLPMTCGRLAGEGEGVGAQRATLRRGGGNDAGPAEENEALSFPLWEAGIPGSCTCSVQTAVRALPPGRRNGSARAWTQEGEHRGSPLPGLGRRNRHVYSLFDSGHAQH
jgi:hypothetical protein